MKPNILNIKLNNEIAYSCPYDTQEERDAWYNNMLAKTRKMKQEVDGEIQIVEQPFLPEHTTEDIPNPDYKPAWEIARREEYLAKISEQLEQIIDLVIYDKADAKTALKDIVDAIKLKHPKA